MAYIRYDPNKPGDRERAYGQFFLGFVVLWGTVGSAIYYLCSIVPFIKGNWSKNVLYSIGFYALMGVLDFFILNVGNKQKRKAAGKFFTIFIGGMLDITAVIASILSILSLCHGGSGLSLLLLSILSILVVTVVIWMLCQKFDGRKIKLFTESKFEDSAQKQAPLECAQSNWTQITLKQELSVIYCHKCGKQLPNDSGFCSSCGTKLK